MAEQDVPASLRAVRRFTPNKRARLGAPSLGAALESDPLFRAAVQARIREGLPALARALEAGDAAPAVEPADVAAAAYVLQSPGWADRVEAARPAAKPEPQPDDERQERRRAQLETARRDAREDADRLRKELGVVRREADDLRRRLGRAESAARRSAEAQALAAEQLVAAQEERDALERELSAQVRRLRSRLRDVEEGAAAARRGVRSERDTETARLKVLLDTVTSAANGLRRELDLPASATRPAELVAQDGGESAPGAPTELLSTLRRGRSATDPSIVDDLLTVPGIHLIVDGYNVTKLGYPTLTLEDQRSRLLNALGGITARAPGAEVTCVFDAMAASARPMAVAAPRGVRVLFSAVGELADQLIVRLAEAEPVGRPVIAVTNDREVIDGVRRAGGDALASEALLRRLDRG
jgi:predicted RNA-binding protein with PIN domain